MPVLEGYEYIIGKHAHDNTHLVILANKNDIWFHINDLPSAHLIMYNPNNESLEKLRRSGIIYKMAVALKKSSKYSKINNISMVYTTIDNVSPTSTPGLVTIKKSYCINS